RMRPTNAEYLNDLGYARLQAGNINGARIPLGQAAELDPSNNKVLANLALLLLMQGEPAQAHAVMDKAGLSKKARDQMQKLATDSLTQPTTHASNNDNMPENPDETIQATIRPTVTAVNTRPVQAASTTSAGSTVWFHQAPLME